MTAISGTQPASLPQPVSKVGSKDADGDNDGSKGTASPAPAQAPVVSKPTETMGNNVNTYA